MLDAQPAPDAHARPPLPAIIIDPPAEPERPVAGDPLGRRIDARLTLTALTAAIEGRNPASRSKPPHETVRAG